VAMDRTVESKNKALVLEAFDTLTTSNTARTLLPVVRACSISSRAFPDSQI
jgi:hypothetical protein